MGIKESNYTKEMDVSSFNEYLKKLAYKNYEEWYQDYISRLETSAVLMKELGIGSRIIEFCDADIHTGSRLETYSDFLIDSRHKPIIVAKNLESGLFGKVETQKSYYGDFGSFNEYVCASNTGIYNTVDSFVIDDTFDRFDKYLTTFLVLNKDCYFPISCYNNTKYKDNQLNKAEKVINIAKKVNFVSVEEVENTDSNNYVKIIKLSKQNK